MASANQIYTIVNAVAKQQFGTAPVTVLDTSTLISLGNAVLNSDTNTDAFVHALTDRIGRTIFNMRLYEESDPNVVKHPFDFGLILQKIYVFLPDAMPDNTWEIGEENYTPQYAPVIKPNIRQKLFKSLNVFELDVTIPDRIMKTAFTGPEGMAVLIDAIFMAIENRIRTAIEGCVNLVRAAFIARKISSGNSCGAINLLAGYNSQFGTSLTAKTALTDTAFLKYATMQINLWCRRLRKMSTLFNDEGYQRFTPREDLVVTVLDDFAAATASYLEADTYHKELVSLPGYDSVPYWQGSGTEYSFTSVSTVNVKLDSENTVVQSGVIGVAYDYQALGAMIDIRKTTTERNNKDEYTNYYNKLERGYFNDMSENGIVFYIADESAPARAYKRR